MNLGLLFRVAAIAGLVIILLITILYASGITSKDNYLNLILAGTLIWFAGIIAGKRIHKVSNGKNNGKQR